MQQKIVRISVKDNEIVVQDREHHYSGTIANFTADNGQGVPSYITFLDYCPDTGLGVLNEGNITEEAKAYAESLILKAGTLFDAKEARENPPAPEPTEEEKQIQEQQEAIREAKQYLDETDYRVIKCLETGLDLETEYPGLKAERQAKRDLINAKEASIATLSAGEV